MIRFALRCRAGHGFDSWFPSTRAFEEQAAQALVRCPGCGSPDVEKALMAPAVGTAQPAPAAPLTTPADDRERRLADLRRAVEQNSEYVGLNFAAEARRIHDGDAPGRAIHGEAKPAEARALIEDGVPVAPLPFIPRRKTN